MSSKSEETLWTATAGSTAWSELLRSLEKLSDEERADLVRRCSEEARRSLKELQRPYEGTVGWETPLRILR